MASESVAKVEVISRSVIKPSSPTPDHLRHLKLSLLDQLSPPIYMAAVIFYEANELKGLTSNTDHGKLIKTLQDSLSTTLTVFYPLAGRLNAADFSINCNDDGVDFVEARVNTRLEDILKDTKYDQLQKYFPVNPLVGLSAGDGNLFLVQVNYLSCGGIAVAACLSHYIGDGWSMFEFMNSWASTCRNETTRHSPYQFGQLGHCFPAIDLSMMNVSLGYGTELANKDFTTKRFVLNKDHLAALKKAAAPPGGDYYPTRMEALSAFIWKNSIDKYVAAGKRRFSAALAVNIRSRAESLGLEHTFGNAIMGTTAYADGSDGSAAAAQPELHELVGKLRHAIRKIDEEYIAKTRSELHHLKEVTASHDLVKRGEIDEFFGFTNCTRFPVYDVDFAWGPPVLICPSGLGIKNIVAFVPTRDGEGIEVFVSLEQEHAEALEQKLKLIVSQS